MSVLLIQQQMRIDSYEQKLIEKPVLHRFLKFVRAIIMNNFDDKIKDFDDEIREFHMNMVRIGLKSSINVLPVKKELNEMTDAEFLYCCVETSEDEIYKAIFKPVYKTIFD